MPKQQPIFYQPEIKTRSQKRLSKSTNPTRRWKRERELIISNEEVQEALDFLGGDLVLKSYNGTWR